jgi:hypothetical protein
MSAIRPQQRTGIRIDWVTVALVLAISLLGLVMVTSASISIASQHSGAPFAYLQRQLILTALGFGAAVLVFCVRTELLEKMSLPLLIVAAALLLAVLIPGIGYTVNGSRRWIRMAGFNMHGVKKNCVPPLPALPSRWRCCWDSLCCCSVSRISAPRPCCSRPGLECCSWPARDCAMSARWGSPARLCWVCS